MALCLSPTACGSNEHVEIKKIPPASAATLAGDSDQSITKTDEVIMNDFSRSFILYHFTPDFTS